MNLDLSGKTALVCGSTQGLGYASAVELALLGCNIVLLARNEAKLIEALKSLPKNAQQNHQYLVADFADTVLVKNVIEEFVKNNTIHILVNNTGGPAGGTALNAQPCKRYFYRGGNYIYYPSKTRKFHARYNGKG